MKPVAVDAFAPLTEEDTEVEPVPPTAGVDATPILPVPAGVSDPTFTHHRHGDGGAVWSYRNGNGALLGHVVRFDKEDGNKEILPRTWCRLANGREAWCWKAFPEPRPLYGLNRLAGHPEAPVLLVEGEKTAEAAQALFDRHVVVTWPGGSNAYGKVDWSPLQGRHIVLWPDADDAGRSAMQRIATLLAKTASTVRLVRLPEHLPPGWDLADPVPDDVDIIALRAEAHAVDAHVELPVGYILTSRGLHWRDPNAEDKPDLLLTDPFEVLAETRDTDGNSWGVLLRWHDHDGREHRQALPRSLLAADGADLRRILLDGGLFVAPSRTARERLTAFLASVRVPQRVTATSRIGWHHDVFVLPDGCLGRRGNEDMLLQSGGAIEHAFRMQGTLEDWQREVARYAIGNSRIAVAVSAAFAACLVHPCGSESGGLHFRGSSSIGKTTALAVAGSVWGGDAGKYIRSWRATSNGLEGVALAHCDALLCLDEIGQLAAREAGEVAYLLANGSGKSRSRRDGSARAAFRWRLLFLSSGEIGLAEKLAEEGKGRKLAAGQQVRVIDVPADAGVSLGLFETLHGHASAEELARHLRQSSDRFFGTAARAFIARLAQDLDGIRAAVKTYERSFIDLHVPPAADGQVLRVAQRFALVAAAGELAVTCGILPWPEGEATTAAARLFRDWLDARGGVEPAEVRDGIEQVRGFLLAHGMSRFVPAWEQSGNPIAMLRDVAGFRKKEGDGWDYYITPTAWRDEVCRGMDARAILGAFEERELLLVPSSGRHKAKYVTVSGYGKLRLYHVPGKLLEEGNDD